MTAAMVLPGGAAIVRLAGSAPDIGRGAAQRLARRELSRAIYQPSLWHRFLTWLLRVFHGADSGFPGGWWALVAAAVAAVLVASAVRTLAWPARSQRRRPARPVLSGRPQTAADHRREAERLAAAGLYSGAIVELVRAIAAGLEERGVLPASAGRTADELAAAAGSALPACRGDLRQAARLFDDVRYGGRAGSQDGYLTVRAAEARLRTARPAAVPASDVPAIVAGPSQ